MELQSISGLRFSDGEWERIRDWLKNHAGIDVGQEAPTRLFLEAILWIARAGAPSRLLPAAFGPGNSVCQRFAPAWANGGRKRVCGKCRWTVRRPTATSRG